MAITDFGISQLGSFILGSTVVFPGSMAFGAGSSVFVGSHAYLNSEFLRKPIAWEWNGTDPRGTVVFGEADANGSFFGELGITNNSTSNGSTMWSRDISAIGSKSAAFALEVIFETRIRRL
ncbi:MAG: hypothetical protein Q8O88_01320 [bacterium]|nr:hypothetical protein [bacterium]